MISTSEVKSEPSEYGRVYLNPNLFRLPNWGISSNMGLLGWGPIVSVVIIFQNHSENASIFILQTPDEVSGPAKGIFISCF